MEITENYIDLKKVLEGKNIHLPKVVISFMNRLLHVKEINQFIYANRDLQGAEFAQAVVDFLEIRLVAHGMENIPEDGNPVIAGNHPLGGPDGVALISLVGSVRKDLRFPVTDFLMHVPGLNSLFIPIDKVHRNTKKVAQLSDAFAQDNALLYFPAGICSRRTGGKIQDLEWKDTFIRKSKLHNRPIIPVLFDAANRKRFYFLANLRKRIGIKFNIEMALLPSEMFAQKGKTIHVYFGRPILPQDLDESKSSKEWAQEIRRRVYELKNQH